jgi:hypothetical protein
MHAEDGDEIVIVDLHVALAFAVGNSVVERGGAELVFARHQAFHHLLRSARDLMRHVEPFFREEALFERNPDRKIGGAGKGDDGKLGLRRRRRGECRRETRKTENCR